MSIMTFLTFHKKSWIKSRIKIIYYLILLQREGNWYYDDKIALIVHIEMLITQYTFSLLLTQYFDDPIHLILETFIKKTVSNFKRRISVQSAGVNFSYDFRIINKSKFYDLWLWTICIKIFQTQYAWVTFYVRFAFISE